MAEVDQIIDQTSEAEKRIKDLSKKTREVSEERDLEKARADKADAERIEAQRERDFYAGFSDSVVANPAAAEFKEDIRAKVIAGYSVEDATYAVLGKAGKLGAPRVVEDISPAGGSATTTAAPAAKGVGDMTREERRNQLIDAQKKGDLFLS